MTRIFLSLLIVFMSCSFHEDQRAEALFNAHCASCHIAPDIKDLPKDIWTSNILPEMGGRMGIRDIGYDPYVGLSFGEMHAAIQTGIFPEKSTIRPEDWKLLKEYIHEIAPDSLSLPEHGQAPGNWELFSVHPVSLDSNGRATVTFLNFDRLEKKLFAGDLSGNVSHYNFDEQRMVSIGRFPTAVVAYSQINEMSYVTTIGNLRPSEIPEGRIFYGREGEIGANPELFHRPVHTLAQDLNNDGTIELVVSEFGDLKGQLTLLTINGRQEYKKSVLLNQPGTIRVIAEDMDSDGKTDLVALTSQGDEGVTILFQKEDLKFTADKVIRFSPVYGSSWIQLADYDGDGDKDIITVNGDNADKSYVLKPYHGLCIHMNDGNNHFEEKYFYSFNGATRFVANDFDQDGDLDFGLLSTFPDYNPNPLSSFVFLENRDSQKFEFSPYTFKSSDTGRWFLMDSGDIDNDGDEDIILSSFSLSFTPVPEHWAKLWKEKDVDIMILENMLKSGKNEK